MHFCNSFRDAVVVGVENEDTGEYAAALYSYLGGGSEYHPPYCYGIVFRDVDFSIAHVLVAVVLSLTGSSVDSFLFYSRAEADSTMPIQESDVNEERSHHIGAVEDALSNLKIDDLLSHYVTVARHNEGMEALD